MSGRIFLVSAALVSAGAAVAAPRSIADCEAIQSADAYNRCLASFGPAASARGRSEAQPAAAERASPRHAREYGAGVVVERSRKGRLRMVLTPHGAR